MSLIKILTKFTNTPGTCTLEEVELVKEFLGSYLKYRDIYRQSTGSDPVGAIIESTLKKVDWYEKNLGD